MPVNHEGVVADLEAVALGHGTLPLLDPRVDELLNAPAIEAEDVIVMRASVELEYRHAVGKVMPGHEPRSLELREHAVNRCQADILARVDEPTIDILGGQVALAARLEDLEDLDARQRDFEAHFAQIVAFHVNLQPFG